MRTSRSRLLATLLVSGFLGAEVLPALAQSSSSPPVVQFKRPRRTQTTKASIPVVGDAYDDVWVIRVRVKVAGSKWKNAKLIGRGNHVKFRTNVRLRKGRNRIKVVAIDTERIRSRVETRVIKRLR